MKENTISHKRLSSAVAETLGYMIACKCNRKDGGNEFTIVRNNYAAFVCFDSNFLKEFGYTNPSAFVKDYFGFDAPDIKLGVYMRFINSEDFKHGFLVHPAK